MRWTWTRSRVEFLGVFLLGKPISTPEFICAWPPGKFGRRTRVSGSAGPVWAHAGGAVGPSHDWYANHIHTWWSWADGCSATCSQRCPRGKSQGASSRHQLEANALSWLVRVFIRFPHRQFVAGGQHELVSDSLVEITSTVVRTVLYMGTSLYKISSPCPLLHRFSHWPRSLMTPVCS